MCTSNVTMLNFISTTSNYVSSWIDRLWLIFIPPALPQMRLSLDETSPNPVMIQFFTWEAQHPDMSWWKHFERELPRLTELGFTQVWLPPPNKAMHGNRGQGYDAYDLWDIGEFNQRGTISTRWGTRQELLDACSTARKNNVGVLIDAILNHKLGADRTESISVVPVDPENRLRDLEPECKIEGWTIFDFAGRQGKYSKMKWNQEHFSGVDWDESTQTKAIYRITGKGHKGWSKQVDTELGNYDYLLGSNIDHRHPAVRDDLFTWGSWILDVTGGSGFRLDAIKHIDRKFTAEFVQRARSVPSRERLFVVAECWTSNVRNILRYVRAFRGQMAFFDVPLHDSFHQASKSGSSFDLRHVFNSSLLAIRPKDAVTFVDNHDTVSDDSTESPTDINEKFQQVGQSLESWVDTNFKIQAYALTLLRRDGLPCVFYGDLYPNDECFDQATSNKIRLLLKARKTFAYGSSRDYFQHKNCIGFVRTGDSERPGCVVVISNESPDDGTTSRRVRMNVGPAGKGGAVFRGLFDTSRSISVDNKGWGDFYCSCNAVEVWVKDSDVDAPANGAADKDGRPA